MAAASHLPQLLEKSASFNLEAVVLLCLLTIVMETNGQKSQIQFHVTEELPSGTLVGNVADASNMASYVNSSVASSLQYQILTSDELRITSVFSVNSRTGSIFTNAMIDREQICSLAIICRLDFDVTVKLGNNIIKLLTVSVIIDDINDNAPIFPSRELILSVPESAPLMSEIPISGAIDRDTGLNTTIRYTLTDSSVFGLEEIRQLDGSSSLRIIVHQLLDRETNQSYSFLILASDGVASGSRTGTLSITVTVSDVNDNEPKFSTETFNLTVIETAPVGTVFGRLVATDSDEGANGEISFRFSILTKAYVMLLFRLNATSGEMMVASLLQYESEKSFQCVVEAIDHGTPPKMSQAILLINLADAGNTPPKLEITIADPVFGGQNAMLTEDVQPGTFVGTLKVDDFDDGPEGQINCMSNDVHFLLQSLEVKRYGIVVAKELDREQQQELNVTIICSDNGEPSLSSTASFRVIVSDVNDNAPVFTQAVYQGSAVENAASLQSVVRIAAIDSDDGLNSEIVYSLSAEHRTFFSINSATGWISVDVPLDREKTPVLTLTVFATDLGVTALTGTATVSVLVSDVNDNEPYLERTDYYVSENVARGYVFDLLINDNDVGVNREVSLSVPSDRIDSESPFSVLSNGSIKIIKELDRETKALYGLTVALADKGSPSLSSTASVTIHVLDYNDNAPQFIFPVPYNSTVRVSAEFPSGAHVCLVLAKDEDINMNGNIMYVISEGNSGNWFGINNYSGEVFVVKGLLGIAGTVARLKITATDSGTPRLSSESTLDIAIGSSNASFLTSASQRDQERHIIIAGVIAGVTLIISVVVIAIIIHMRTSDVRRSERDRTKSDNTDTQGTGDLKSVPVYCSDAVHVENGNGGYGLISVDNSINFSVDEGGNVGHASLTSVPSANQPQITSVLTKHALEIHAKPTEYLIFHQPKQSHLICDDHTSDTSGETTTCDSGRGASDEEVTYPPPSNSIYYRDGYRAAEHLLDAAESAPRIPPRQPLSPVSGMDKRPPGEPRNECNPVWPPSDTSGHISDDACDSETTNCMSFDLSSTNKKVPMRVRFSFDNGTGFQSDPKGDNDACGTERYRGDAVTPRQHHIISPDTYKNHAGSDVIRSWQAQRESRCDGAATATRPHDSDKQEQFSEGWNLEAFHSFTAMPGTTFLNSRQEVLLHPDKSYPRYSFPEGRDKYSHGLPQHVGFQKSAFRTDKSFDSLSSLPHSVDDDDSTTTSGSYSIDFDDVMSASMEC